MPESGQLPRSYEGKPKPGTTVAVFDAMKVFFLMSFCATFAAGAVVNSVGEPIALMFAIVGAIAGLALHLNTRRILAGLIYILRNW